MTSYYAGPLLGVCAAEREERGVQSLLSRFFALSLSLSHPKPGWHFVLWLLDWFCFPTTETSNIGKGPLVKSERKL